jgi:hypothetical protein
MSDLVTNENFKPLKCDTVERQDGLAPESKRSKRSSSFLANQAGGNGVEMDWKQLFHALRDERMTAAEEQLGAYMSENQKLVSSLKLYTSYLQEQLEKAQGELSKESNEKEQAKQRCTELETRVQDLERSQLDSKRENFQLKTNIESLETDIKQRDRELWMYRKLTSTTLANCECNAADVQDPNLFACNCSVVNQATDKSTIFRLSSFYDEVDKSLWFRYIPVANQQYLPDFLHHNIEFHMNQLPSLLQNVILSIFPEEDEEEDS